MDTPVVTPPPAKSVAKEVVICLILLALFVGGFLFGIHAYRAETENKAADLAEEAPGPDYIEARVKISAVDPIKGEMSTKIEFVPHGSFTKDDGVTLSRPLKLYVNSYNAKQEYSFEAGKRMTPVESVVDLYEGEVSDFPFDKHGGDFIMYFEPGKAAPPKTAAIRMGSGGQDAGQDEEPAAPVVTPPPAAVEGTPTPAATETPAATPGVTTASAPPPPRPAPAPAKVLTEDEIPVVVSIAGTVSGLKIEANPAEENTAEYVDIEMHVSRATTALAFSYFIMTIQWALTVGVVCIAFLVLTGRRKVEFGLLGYFGGLLFAFPALRNSMPGTPPIGSFGDFISFFWAEIILAVCLFSIMMKYLRTPAK